MKEPKEIINGKLSIDGSSGDGKRLYMSADTNDGWKDLRIEIDTDDCDDEHAKMWAKRIVACVNFFYGNETP